MVIEQDVKNLSNKIKEDKKFFWNHPEKGFEEFETSKYIIKRLQEIGCDYKTNIAKTGIMVTIKGKKERPCILLRCDMDALEMDKTGRMKHTCGHDAHMAIMLAVCELIMKNKDKFNGTIKILFQPAEETSGGAKKMIEEGVLENPNVDCVFALHVWSELKTGVIGIGKGAIMASTDPFDVVVTGKGGHAGLPEKCIDPIYIAGEIITNLQSIVGKNVSPHESAVVSITAVNGGNNNNMIPDKVEMKGICRTFNNSIRDFIKNRINDICKNIAESMDGKAEVIFKNDCYPAVVNNNKYCEIVKSVSENIIGKENIVEDYKTMCAEDFAYFLQERSGAFIFIGCQGDEYYPQHSENFCVNMEAMLVGVQVMYDLVKKICGYFFSE